MVVLQGAQCRWPFMRGFSRQREQSSRQTSQKQANRVVTGFFLQIGHFLICLFYSRGQVMPTGTKVEKMYTALRRMGKDAGTAARIAQAKSGQALSTGKPPKKKGSK